VSATTHARDLTVLVDASGSMSGRPLERAKAVVDRLLDGLGPADRFEILAFAIDVLRLGTGRGGDDGLQPATDAAIDGARRALRRLSAGGGTEMASAIDRALEPLRADSQRQVVLLTDGYIGFEHEVIGRLVRSLPAGARLHAIGVGAAPNRTLTGGAARAGRGIELVVGSDAEVGPVARRLVAATRAPVLTELAVAGDAVRAVAPERPRDILAGQPLVLAVELTPAGGTVEVTGHLAGQAAPWRATIPVPPASDAQADRGTACRPSALPLGALFGREAVTDVEMHLAATIDADENGALLERIEALGLRHRIATRRTSLVAVADEPTVDPREPRRRERLPVELPAEVSAEGVGLMAGLAGGMVPCTAPASARGLVDDDTLIAAEEPLYLRREPGRPAPRAMQALVRRFKKQMRSAMSMIPTSTVAVFARCVRRERDRLVVEFEAPGSDFELPAMRDALDVVLPDGRVLEARIDASRSTRPGRIDEGRTVRLVLVIAGERGGRGRWPEGRVTLVWPGGTRGARPGGGRTHTPPRFTLTVTIADMIET
jgi:hypothetical protein